MQLASDMKLNIGGSAGHCPLHVTTENTTYGKNAIFGAGGWVNSANYHYTDANISLLGQDADGNQKGAGVEFTARNTGGTNWLHGALTFGRDGDLRLFNGGAGNYVGTERFRIASDGVIHVNSSDSASGGRLWANSSALYLQSGNGRQGIIINDAAAGVNRSIEMTSSGNLSFPSGNGIDFSATGDASGMSDEILDDYEEGSWTPALSNQGTMNYSHQIGRYTKIGRQVHFVAYVRWNSRSNNGSYNITYSGLPFSSANFSGYLNPAIYVGGIEGLSDNNSSRTHIGGNVYNNSSTGQFRTSNLQGQGEISLHGGYGSTSAGYIYWGGSYYTS